MDSRASLLAVLFCLSVSRAQLYEGETCQLDDGRRGVCRTVNACPGARDEIVRGSLPKICSFQNHAPIVCCQVNSGTTRRPTTRATTPTTRATTPPTRRTTPSTRRTTPTTMKSTNSVLTSGSNIRRLDETRVSGRKCWEYGQYVYWQRELPILSIVPQYYNVTECHQSVSTLIVGGVEAVAKEFPHMAALGFGPENRIEWKCGGSLISERFVLTAAHCLSARGLGAVNWVRLGDLNINSTQDDNEFILTMKVVERIKHEGYKPPSHYNDIALLRLESDVTISPFVRPACLYNLPGNPVGLPNATATGWGKLDFTEDLGSEKLMKVSLSLQDASRCNHTYRSLIAIGTRLRNGIDPESMVCAGDPRGEKDTCVGDSGGPLQIDLKEPYCMYSIIGLTSFGVTACGKGDNPAVYTRISNFIPWIESHVWPQN